MTYADQCLERASKAAAGPWENVSAECAGCDEPRAIQTDKWSTIEDRDFMAHARTDVPELARRLKRACEAMRDVTESKFSLKFVANELERPLVADS